MNEGAYVTRQVPWDVFSESLWFISVNDDEKVV